MDIIHVLPEKTAQLIAAGEVVESPASVVKELVENSIDAGATKISVEIQNGGTSLIKVTDNGKGMSVNDAKNCFLRHATSKVSTPEDIYKLITLGFRGEALASIVSVSKVRLTTAQEDAVEGVSICVEGGKITDISPIGCRKGTSITVKDLFYNTPARKKFLKSERAEASAIASLMDKLALSHPNIMFRYTNNAKEELFAPGSGELITAVSAVWGSKLSSQMLEVKASGDMNITGYISKPLFSKPSRQMQLFYINKRMVQSRMLSAAVEDAYKGSIMTGKFPACIINIEVDASFVDVNVHPSKSIVKFSDEKLIFSAVRRAVSLALLGEKQQYTAVEKPKTINNNEITSAQAYATLEGFVDKTATQQSLKIDKASAVSKKIVLIPPQTKATEFTVDITNDKSNVSNIGNTVTFNDVAQKKVTDKGEEVIVIDSDKLPFNINIPQFEIKEEPQKADEEIEIAPLSVRFVGEVLKSYIIAESGEEVYIIDKHAAHERLIFENLKSNAGSIVSQPLLLSVNMEIDKTDKSVLLENIGVLSECGFEIEDMWGNNISVKAIPQILADEDTESALMDIAEKLRAGKTDIKPDKLSKILEITSCKAAVKAGQRSAPEELQKLINSIFSIPDIKYCPHGRPIIYTLTKKDFEKFFKRIV